MAENNSDYPSVWSIISECIGHTIEVAVNRTLDHFVAVNRTLDHFVAVNRTLDHFVAVNRTLDHFSGYSLNLQSFKNGLINLLNLPMTKIPVGPFMGHGNQTVSGDINATVYQAVFGAVNELNISITSNLSSLSFESSLAKRLTEDIDMKVFNEILRNSTDGQANDSFDDFFHNLPLKDETLFVALVCMAIIVPIIFITLFIIFFYKKRQDNKERSHEMLLREQPENAVEEFKGERQAGSEPPDLNLKVAPA